MITGCGDSASDQAPQTEVTGVRQTSFQGMDIPTGDQGPHTGDPVAPTGYDRSPAGAALAAVSATVRLSVADDTQWPSIGEKLIAPGTARDEWAIARAQLSITDPVTAHQAPIVLAYGLGEHTDDTVTVRIYSRLSDRSITENTATVTWIAGDWRLQLPDTESSPVRSVPAVPEDAMTLTEDS